VEKKGTNKATVAANRKLLTCIWYMLMKNETIKYSNDNEEMEVFS